MLIAWGMLSLTQVSHADIAHRAHQIWEQTGKLEGYEIEQWLQAERELLQEKARNFVHEWEDSEADPPEPTERAWTDLHSIPPWGRSRVTTAATVSE